MFNIPLTRPYISQKVKDSVLAVLDSGHLTEGPVTRNLEEAIRDYVGAKHCLAATSCTTGLELALRAIGVGPGDEVIVPDYTYPATANAASILGAKIIVVDIDPRTLLIDYDSLERTVNSATKAIIPVSLFGNPLDYDRLAQIKDKYDLRIIEDAACALGASYRGKRVGSLADITVFSLHPRKFITSGEGGIVATDNAAWAEWMLSYKHFGLSQATQEIHFERIGTNFKMSDLQAAVALGQMADIDLLLVKRREMANRYHMLFENASHISAPETTKAGAHSYQTYCVFVQDQRRILNAMRKAGIEVQIGSYALHKYKIFSDNKQVRITDDMKGSQEAYRKTLALPLFQDMTESQQNYVADVLFKMVGDR